MDMDISQDLGNSFVSQAQNYTQGGSSTFDQKFTQSNIVVLSVNQTIGYVYPFSIIVEVAYRLIQVNLSSTSSTTGSSSEATGSSSESSASGLHTTKVWLCVLVSIVMLFFVTF
jgi:hypothetical protein